MSNDKGVTSEDELRRLAALATPGPWEADTREVGDCVVWAYGGEPDEDGHAPLLMNIGRARLGMVGVGYDAEPHDARYIAAVDPPAVLALTTELTRFRARNAELEAQNRRLVEDDDGREFSRVVAMKARVAELEADFAAGAQDYQLLSDQHDKQGCELGDAEARVAKLEAGLRKILAWSTMATPRQRNGPAIRIQALAARLLEPRTDELMKVRVPTNEGADDVE